MPFILTVAIGGLGEYFAITGKVVSDFTTWHAPVPEKCPSCGNVGAEKRSTKARGEYLRCLKCEHQFSAEETEKPSK